MSATTVPALTDAEILCSQLVWTIEQILLYAQPIDAADFDRIQDALRMASGCGRLVRQAGAKTA
jgi:hypothetical protein